MVHGVLSIDLHVYLATYLPFINALLKVSAFLPPLSSLSSCLLSHLFLSSFFSPLTRFNIDAEGPSIYVYFSTKYYTILSLPYLGGYVSMCLCVCPSSRILSLLCLFRWAFRELRVVIYGGKCACADDGHLHVIFIRSIYISVHLQWS